MMSPFNQIKQQLKCLFPKASKKGIDAVACILNQCCSFDPCDISTGQTVTFTSYTLIGQELCIVITVDNVAQSRCITLPSGFIQTITTYVDSTTVDKHAIGVYTNETPTPVTVYETDTKITSLLTSVGNNRIGVYNSENATLTNIYETGTYLDTFFLTGNILTLNYVGEAGTTSRTVDLTPIIPTVPVYTSSQGVSKNTLDFRLGDTAVSGTGDSANPLTSDRDITGAFRLSLKNDRVLIGSDNVQDNVLDVPGVNPPVTGNIKLNVVGNTGGYIFNAVSSTGKSRFNITNDGLIQIGNTGPSGYAPFLTISEGAVGSAHDNARITYNPTGPLGSGAIPNRFVIAAATGNIGVTFRDGFSSSVDKYIFQVPILAANSTQIANVKLETNTSQTHQGLSYSGTSNIAELQLKHTNSEYATTAIPKQSGLLIDGDYVMPRIYTAGGVTGEVNFVNLTPSYNRSAIGGATIGITPLRGFYYAPTINSNAIGVTDEIAYQSTRGSVIIGNGSTKDTLRLPSLTTTQRNTVTALTSIGESTNVAKLVYNSDNKLVEYHNGLGWVTQTPETLASGSVGWNACNTNKDLTLDANTSVAITNLVPGSTLVLVATQDVVGARTLTITASGFTIKTAGTLDLTALATNLINIYVKSASELLVSIVTGYV